MPLNASFRNFKVFAQHAMAQLANRCYLGIEAWTGGKFDGRQRLVLFRYMSIPELFVRFSAASTSGPDSDNKAVCHVRSMRDEREGR